MNLNVAFNIDKCAVNCKIWDAHEVVRERDKRKST
jgi:hypothetical protein